MAVMNPYNYRKPAQAVGNKPVSENPSYLQKNNSLNKVDVYLEQKIMNARPEELTLMLYEGVIKFVSQAMIYNDQTLFEKSNVSNIRAQEILQELRSTLNMDVEISKNLESLYLFMMERLVDANITKSNETLNEVLDLVKDLRDTWKTAMNL